MTPIPNPTGAATPTASPPPSHSRQIRHHRSASGDAEPWQVQCLLRVHAVLEEISKQLHVSLRLHKAAHAAEVIQKAAVSTSTTVRCTGRGCLWPNIAIVGR